MSHSVTAVVHPFTQLHGTGRAIKRLMSDTRVPMTSEKLFLDLKQASYRCQPTLAIMVSARWFRKLDAAACEGWGA